MGTKAFLQKGRTRPGIVLPANAVATVNRARDRGALVREAEYRQAMAESLPSFSSHIVSKYAPVSEVETEPCAVDSIEPEAPEFEPQSEPEPESVPEPEAVEPESEPDPSPLADSEFDPAPEAPVPETLPITLVTGIGAALAERFANYGYRTLEDLADADPDVINQIPGARQRGRQWIDDARKQLGR